MKTNYYRAHVGGFNYQGYGVQALQNWWNEIKAAYNMSGDVLQICEASVISDNNGVVTATYNSENIKKFNV